MGSVTEVLEHVWVSSFDQIWGLDRVLTRWIVDEAKFRVPCDRCKASRVGCSGLDRGG